MESLSALLAELHTDLTPAADAFWIEYPQFAQPPRTPEQTKRRYSKKGEASGSIKERIGNKKRKRPSTSYFYEWYDNGRKQQRYVQTALMNEVSQMIAQRRPSAEIIQFLNQRSKSKPHHTQEAK